MKKIIPDTAEEFTSWPESKGGDVLEETHQTTPSGKPTESGSPKGSTPDWLYKREISRAHGDLVI